MRRPASPIVTSSLAISVSNYYTMGLLSAFALGAVALQSELAFANAEHGHPRPKSCQLELPVTNDIFHQVCLHHHCGSQLSAASLYKINVNSIAMLQ